MLRVGQRWLATTSKPAFILQVLKISNGDYALCRIVHVYEGMTSRKVGYEDYWTVTEGSVWSLLPGQEAPEE